jgi:hypothetical protein
MGLSGISRPRTDISGISQFITCFDKSSAKVHKNTDPEKIFGRINANLCENAGVMSKEEVPAVGNGSTRCPP